MRPQSFYYKRAIKFANYILENKCTISKTAKAFKVSDGTVNQALKHVLPCADKELALKVENHMKINKSKGVKKINKTPRVLVECECTNCKHNNAVSKHAKGYCTLGKITLVYKEFDLRNGDETDVADCEMFHFMYKGKEFMKG